MPDPVTAFVAVTAGAALLRERAESDATVGLRSYGRGLRAVARTGWQGFVVPSVLLAVLGADYVALRSGLGRAVPMTAALIALVGCVFLLRAAAAWRPDRPWRTVATTAARHLTGDLPGSAVLGAAALTAVLLAGWVPAVTTVVLGPLCLAAAAVEDRHLRAPAGRPTAG